MFLFGMVGNALLKLRWDPLPLPLPPPPSPPLHPPSLPFPSPSPVRSQSCWTQTVSRLEPVDFSVNRTDPFCDQLDRNLRCRTELTPWGAKWREESFISGEQHKDVVNGRGSGLRGPRRVRLAFRGSTDAASRGCVTWRVVDPTGCQHCALGDTLFLCDTLDAPWICSSAPMYHVTARTETQQVPRADVRKGDWRISCGWKFWKVHFQTAGGPKFYKILHQKNTFLADPTKKRLAPRLCETRVQPPPPQKKKRYGHPSPWIRPERDAGVPQGIYVVDDGIKLPWRQLGL